MTYKNLYTALFLLLLIGVVLSCGDGDDGTPTSDDVPTESKLSGCWKVEKVSVYGVDNVKEQVDFGEPFTFIRLSGLYNTESEKFSGTISNQYITKHLLASLTTQRDALRLNSVFYDISSFSASEGTMTLTRNFEDFASGKLYKLSYEMKKSIDCPTKDYLTDISETDFIDCWKVIQEEGFIGGTRYLKFKEKGKLILYNFKGSNEQEKGSWSIDNGIIKTLMINDVKWIVESIIGDRIILSNRFINKNDEIIDSYMVLEKSKDCPEEKFENSMTAFIEGLDFGELEADFIDFYVVSEDGDDKKWSVSAEQKMDGNQTYNVDMSLETKNGVNSSKIAFRRSGHGGADEAFIATTHELDYYVDENGIIIGTFSFDVTNTNNGDKYKFTDGKFKVKKE